MNSWKSSSLRACAPPLITLNWGTGIRGPLTDPRKVCQRERPARSAKARAAAIDTPTTALAPRRDLFSVPSSSITAASSAARLSKVRPRSVSAISPFTLATAPSTP